MGQKNGKKMVGIFEPHTKNNLPYVRMVNNWAAGLNQKVTIVGTPNHDSCEKMQISFMEVRFRDQQFLITYKGEEVKAEGAFPFKPGKDFKLEITLNKTNPTVITVDGVEIKHGLSKYYIDDYLHLVTFNGEAKLHEFHVSPEPTKQLMEANSRVVITPANAAAFLSFWDGHKQLYQSGYFHYLSGFTHGKRIVLDVAMAKDLPYYAIELVSMENRIGPGFKLIKPFVLVIEFEKRKVYFASRLDPEETDNAMFEYLSERFQATELKKPFPFFYDQRLSIEFLSDLDKSAVEVKINGADFGRLDVEQFDLAMVNMLVVGYYFKLYSVTIEPEVDQHLLSGGVGGKPGGGTVLESFGKFGRILKTPYTYHGIGGFVPPKWFRIFAEIRSKGYFNIEMYDNAGSKLFHFGVYIDPPNLTHHDTHRYWIYCWVIGMATTHTVCYGEIPIVLNRPFALDLTAGTKEIHIDIDGKRFYTAGGWKEEDLKRVNTLKIFDNIVLFGVYSERTGNLKLPYECDLFGFLPPTHFRIFGSPQAGVFYVRLYDKKAGDDKDKYILSFAVNLGADGKKFIDRWWVGKPDYKEKIAEGATVPFSVGVPFMLDVLAGNDQIVFYVNGKKFNTVATTVVDMQTISKLKVYENIHLHSVELGVPYSADIKEGFIKAGKKIRMVLILLNEGDTRTRFDMFDKMNDILFHFGIRPDTKKAVRNTYKKTDGWMKEENDGSFPFVMEKQFVLEFVAQKEKIEIVVDGKKEFEFKARDDLSEVVKFEVSGELVLQSVNVLEK
uniref:Galectin domain-containing protein n=1 Tax=Globodera rostochiensis TaxID=31243 RepID=A0A914H2B1_GLORO